MSLVSHHRRALQYDAWANDEYFRAAVAAESYSARAIQWIAHIVAAKLLWMDRLKRQAPRCAVWPSWVVGESTAMHRVVSTEFESYLANLADGALDLDIQYANSKGEPWSSQIGDILTHVAFHGSYHRGQIASDVRSTGLVPPYTDFIHAARQRLI